eukprot:TRINITY_DN14985_c0_g1_i1.p1 TRINITY_DN14985_c0_g1~~TRINITY_DN14985_c0_g1_i1.p1  ORF type:complete len:371 (+),score=35.35 TRINITY_DN14985_c0_g1_i1:156-1268(+)
MESSPAVRDPPRASKSGPDQQQEVGVTTVKLERLSASLQLLDLVDELSAAGFDGKWDFLYVPANKQNFQCKGYCFINFTSPESMQTFQERVADCTFTVPTDPDQPDLVTMPALVQGFAGNWRHFAQLRVQKGHLRCRPVFLRDYPGAPLKGEAILRTLRRNIALAPVRSAAQASGENAQYAGSSSGPSAPMDTGATSSSLQRLQGQHCLFDESSNAGYGAVTAFVSPGRYSTVCEISYVLPEGGDGEIVIAERPASIEQLELTYEPALLRGAAEMMSGLGEDMAVAWPETLDWSQAATDTARASPKPTASSASTRLAVTSSSGPAGEVVSGSYRFLCESCELEAAMPLGLNRGSLRMVFCGLCGFPLDHD